jgi:hypothetical protein
MEGGGTILPPLAFSKKARQHLTFLQPFAMCTTNAFRVSFKQFFLFTELKVQFNHVSVNFGFQSLVCWSHFHVVIPF